MPQSGVNVNLMWRVMSGDTRPEKQRFALKTKEENKMGETPLKYTVVYTTSKTKQKNTFTDIYPFAWGTSYQIICAWDGIRETKCVYIPSSVVNTAR